MISTLSYSRAIVEASASDHRLTLEDGTELFYRAWVPAEPTRKSLIIFHRGHEHSGRIEDVIKELRLDDVAVFAWDARGHGLSEGQRGYAPSFACLARDADEFVRHLVETFGISVENTIVLGQSIGAVIAATWIHDYAPKLKAMVLITPALQVKLYVPLARTFLRLIQLLLPKRRLFVSSYVAGSWLTHDRAQAASYDADPLVSRAIAVNVLLGLHKTAKRLIADAEAIQIPALILAGGADRVVSLRAERGFFDRLGSRCKRMRVFDGMYHDILHEKDRRHVIEEIRGFVRGAFATDFNQQSSETTFATQAEYQKLCRPLPLLSPGRIRFSAQRAFMKTAGRMSKGIRIGWRTGFDSGASLDYVYENRAQGTAGIGRMFDRVYLNSAGWAGVRQRKRNLEKLLRYAFDLVDEHGLSIQLMDVAAGQGRYVLDVLSTMKDCNVRTLLRDYDSANLEAAREFAAKRNLRNVDVERADAFDPRSYDSMSPRPNIVTVSGLFELFPENEKVSICLEGISNVIEEGGYLIYTGQPWHPQLEMIARVLTNRDGERWIMRRRAQTELDELVREAGFRKIRTLVDKRGIFTVSIARRTGEGR
jgi:alpha-beta hydrolase superfamily lysophospholipase